MEGIRIRTITIEEIDKIENTMIEKGYLPYEYNIFEKTIETDVMCPACGENLMLFVKGNSYQITCKIDTCIKITFRGI